MSTEVRVKESTGHQGERQPLSPGGLGPQVGSVFSHTPDTSAMKPNPRPGAHQHTGQGRAPHPQHPPLTSSAKPAPEALAECPQPG